jgi:hypothetical protein
LSCGNQPANISLIIVEAAKARPGAKGKGEVERILLLTPVTPYQLSDMRQELSEVRMVHLKAGEAGDRIQTEFSPTANTIFRAPEIHVPHHVNPGI